MVHMRIVVPSYQSEHVLELLQHLPSACNVIFLERAAQKPVGDVILCDITREDASVIISVSSASARSSATSASLGLPSMHRQTPSIVRA